jgi:ribosomal protein L15E
VSPFEFASVRFALGQTDLGFRWLKNAVEDRAFDVIALNVDPRFEALKNDKGLQAIIQQLGLAWR